MGFDGLWFKGRTDLPPPPMVSDLLLASLDDCSDVLFERAVVSDWQQVPVLGPFISATLCSYAYVRTFIQGLEERLVNLEVGHGVWGLCLNLVAIYGFESGVVKPTDVKTSNDAGCRGKFPKRQIHGCGRMWG